MLCLCRKKYQTLIGNGCNSSCDFVLFQVVALDGTVIHVTCTQGGFYVNASGRGNFDPKPIAGNPCHSHELAVCLLSRNPSFAKVLKLNP